MSEKKHEDNNYQLILTILSVA